MGLYVLSASRCSYDISSLETRPPSAGTGSLRWIDRSPVYCIRHWIAEGSSPPHVGGYSCHLPPASIVGGGDVDAEDQRFISLYRHFVEFVVSSRKFGQEWQEWTPYTAGVVMVIFSTKQTERCD
jgi:hypothetical protein